MVRVPRKKKFYVVFHRALFWAIYFFIFIYDLPNATSLFTLLFADDTTFYNSKDSIEELFLSTNIELGKAKVWFESNKRSLNVSTSSALLQTDLRLDLGLKKLVQ